MTEPTSVQSSAGSSAGFAGSERAYLDAFRDANVMPDAARERVWAKLAGGPVGPVGGAAANDAGPMLEAVGAGGRAWWSRPGFLIGASVAVVSGALVLALSRGEPPVESRTSGPEVVVAAAGPSGEGKREPIVEIPQPPVEILEPEPLAPEEVKAVELVEVAPVVKRTSPRVRTKPMPQERTSSLAEERRLIERTHAALGRGEPDVALTLLRQHAREFEDGVFVEEREGLRAIATCSAGQLDEGRVAALGFLKMYPQAVLAARVRKSCALGE